MSRRARGGGRIVVAVVAVLAAAAAAAAAFGLDLGSGDDKPEQSAGPQATTEVVRQTLVENVSKTGDLGYGEPTDLAARLNGTVTDLPETGDEIERGDKLFGVDDTPVVLLYGSLPAYRELAPGMKGRDVEQFEKNLAELGYDGFTPDKEYTWKTAAAVKKWQKDLGIEQTGSVELGRVVFAPGKIRVEKVSAAVGDSIGGEAILSYSGLDRIVSVNVELSDRELVAVGNKVELTLPDGSTAPGTVKDSETVTTEGDEGGEGGEAKTQLKVTVATDDPSVFDGLDQASVKVGFDGKRAEDVLTVPVAALLALAEGGYGVEVVDGAEKRIVAVETGLFADGNVEISGEGIKEGMTVGMPS